MSRTSPLCSDWEQRSQVLFLIQVAKLARELPTGQNVPNPATSYGMAAINNKPETMDTEIFFSSNCPNISSQIDQK